MKKETRAEQLKRWAGKGAWIAVDLDGTLAQYDGWRGEAHIGEPVQLMLQRVKDWLAAGVDVRIMTARAEDESSVVLIRSWCLYHVGQELPVTNKKDFKMIELYDDRAIQVERNTGRLIGVPEDEQ